MDRPNDRAPKGYVIHESPDSPVIAVAILNSDNRKTGNMIQVYILDRSQHPVEAVQNGTDDTICGDCPLRAGNGCYVAVWQGPASVWKQYRAGKYPLFDRSNTEHVNTFRGRSIRWGAYGDPVYIPYNVIAYFNSLVENWTGYTHQWRTCDPIYVNVFMASCETQSQVFTANIDGWRTFATHNSDLKPTNSIWCPASPEGGNKTHCVSCGLCNGSRGENDPRKNIVIKPHGKNKQKLFLIK
jgi:hypothetical protein